MCDRAREAAMKLYRIVYSEGVWQAWAGEPEHAVAASDDRDQLTQVARQLAARHAGEVHVHDAAGDLEIIYAYPGGIESFRFPRPLRTQMVRSETGKKD
jgi:hypothetical protein